MKYEDDAPFGVAVLLVIIVFILNMIL